MSIGWEMDGTQRFGSRIEKYECWRLKYRLQIAKGFDNFVL